MWQSCGKRQRLCFSEIEKSSQQDTVSSFIILYSFYTPGAAPVVACAAGPEEFPEEIVTSAGEDGAGDAGLVVGAAGVVGTAAEPLLPVPEPVVLPLGVVADALPVPESAASVLALLSFVLPGALLEPPPGFVVIGELPGLTGIVS